MVNLREITILTALFLPIIFAVFFIFSKREYIKWAVYVQLGITSLCLLLLLTAGSFEWYSGLNFFGEAVYFNFSSTPIILFLFVQLSLWLIISNKYQSEDFPRFFWILLNIALVSGFVAFFSGQFMIRYIALEIVGLCTALSSINSISDFQGYKNFGLILLFLRLGDIGLWSSILILQNHTGSLDISEMISAAVELNPQNQAWVIAGFLLAIGVKTALWPFGLWLQSLSKNEGQWIYWMPRILMPSLGLYLLYRIRPILQSQDAFVIIIAILVVGLLLLFLFAGHMRWLRMSRRKMFNNLMMGMAIFLSLFSSSNTLVYYLLAVVGLSTVLILEGQFATRFSFILCGITFFLLNVIIGFIGFQSHSMIILLVWLVLAIAIFYWTTQWIVWLSNPFISKDQRNFMGRSKIAGNKLGVDDRLARMYASVQWIYQQSEINLFAQIFSLSSHALLKIANWTLDNVEVGLEKLWVGLTSGVVKISQTTFNQVEMKMEELLANISKALMQLSKTTLIQIEEGGSRKTANIVHKMIGRLGQYEENSRHRSFRWDLLWVPLVLVVIIIFLVISQRG